LPTIDEILAGSPLAGLRRVSAGGGDREVVSVRLAERFADLDQAPAGSFVLLSRSASAEASDYRLDMALRWAAMHEVAAVATFSEQPWQPPVTVIDIAMRAGIALIWLPPDADLGGLVHAIMREIGGGAEQVLGRAEQVLGRAEQGLAAVLQAEDTGADIGELCAALGRALATAIEFCPARSAPAGDGHVGPAAGGPSGAGGVSVPVVAGDREIGRFVAPAPMVTWRSGSGWCCTQPPSPLPGCLT
jgi:hypothetical protein